MRLPRRSVVFRVLVDGPLVREGALVEGIDFCDGLVAHQHWTPDGKPSPCRIGYIGVVLLDERDKGPCAKKGRSGRYTAALPATELEWLTPGAQEWMAHALTVGWSDDDGSRAQRRAGDTSQPDIVRCPSCGWKLSCCSCPAREGRGTAAQADSHSTRRDDRG